jgi:hypothetical protein
MLFPFFVSRLSSSLYRSSHYKCPTNPITSSVGRPKHVRIMAGAVEGDVFIGRRAQELRGLLKIKYPIEHGIVNDWEDMERIWQYIYTDELKTLSEEVWLEFHFVYIVYHLRLNINFYSILFCLLRHHSILAKTETQQRKSSLKHSMSRLSSLLFKQY